MDKKSNFETAKPAESISDNENKPKENTVGLDLETLAFIKRHSDIDDFFAEKELQTIRYFVKNLPLDLQSSARRTLIDNFKKKLAETRKNSAKAQVEIENFIRDNQNKSDEEVINELNKIITLNNLDPLYFDFADAIEKFLEGRNAVRETVDNYKSIWGEKWQEELFRDLFGNLPRGRIVVEVLSANIFIKIFDLEDYLLAYNYNGQNSSENEARNSYGARLGGFKKFPMLKGKILIENTSVVNPYYSPRVKSHEEEHSIFLYYKQALSQNPNIVSKLEKTLHSIRGEVDYDNLAKIIDDWALSWVLSWELFAKSEVLASLKDGHDAYSILSNLEDDDGLYNYFDEDQGMFKEKILRFVTQNKISIKDRHLDQDEILALAHDKLLKGWGKYKKDINTALLAVVRIFKRYQKSPDDRLKIIRLLSQEPLNKWHRLEKMLS